MTTGLNYGNHEGNVYTSYFGALTETAREQKMGIVYWPGLRTGDAYSMTDLVDPTTSRSTAPAVWPSCNGAGACSRTSRSTTSRPRRPVRCCGAWQQPLRRRPGLLDHQRHRAGPVGLQRRRQPVVELDR